MLKPLCGALALCWSLVASAATVTIDWQSGGSYGVFDPAAGMPVGTISGSAVEAPVTTRAGRFLGEISTTSGVSIDEFFLAPDHFFAYCHDLDEVLRNSTYSVELGASDPVLAFLGAVNAVLPGDSVYDWISPTDKYIAGAVQLGIWEALYDTGFDLAGGDLTFGKASDNTINAAMLDHYNSFVAAMNQGAGSALESQYVMRLTNEVSQSSENRQRTGTQDVITARVPPPPALRFLVPEPGSLLLGGLAAAAAALTRRRS